MPGLTQADVTPNAVEEEEQEEQKDEGYQWGRWLSNPGNELRFLGNQVGKSLEAARELNSGVTGRGRVGLLKLYSVEGDDGVMKPGATPLQRNALAGAQEATADVGLQAISAVQQSTENLAATVQNREPVQTDVGDTAVGRLLMDSKDATARALGIPERSDLTDDNRWVRDLPSVLTSGAYAYAGMRLLGLTPGKNPTLLTGTRVNPYSSSFGNLVNIQGPWGAFWRGSSASRNFARSAIKWGLFGAGESAMTTLISNQTESGYADPNDSLWTAAVKSVPGNTRDDLTLGSLIGGTGLALGKVLQAPSSIARSRRAAKTTQDVKNARQWTADNGLQTQRPDGTYEFTTDKPYDVDLGDGQVQADAAPKTPREALDQLEDGWDPAMPEVDTVKRGLDRVDPSELPNIASEVAEGTPVTEAVGRRLDAPEAAPVDVEVGPPVKLPIEVVTAMVMGFDVPTLRAMAQSNPGVAQILRGMGESPLTASRTDLADAVVDASAKGEPMVVPQRVPETTVDPGQADVVKGQILREAIDSGQVRPSATEIPEFPEPPQKNPSDMTAMEQLAEEDRLQGEWTQRDNAKAEQDARAIREADGYYQKSEAEQAAAGKYDGWDEPVYPGSRVMPFDDYQINPDASIVGDTGLTAAQISRLDNITPEGRARLEADVLSDTKKRNRLKKQAENQAQNDRVTEFLDDEEALRNTPDDQVPVVPAKAKSMRVDFELEKDEFARRALRYLDSKQSSAPTQQFTLPADVAKSAPRFGMAKITFASDLDRAAYIIRNKAKASKGEARIIKALEEQGYDIAEIRARGDEVKTLIQDVIEEQTGSRRAPQSAMELQIPDTDTIRDPDAMMSAGGPELPPIGEAERLRMTAALEEMANKRVADLEDQLRGIADQIFGDDFPAMVFREGPGRKQATPKEWGGDGKRKSSPGGQYFPLRDVIQINDLLNKPLLGDYGLQEIVAHESWHRIQAGYLTPKESKVLSNVFGKQDIAALSDFHPYHLKTIQPIELQAVAFQKFFSMREAGFTRMDAIREGVVELLDQQFPKKRGSWGKTLTAEALTVLVEGWERIIQFYKRSMNFIEGNGFKNVYDVFEDAYQGRLTANRKMESFAQVLREADRIPDMTEAEFDEWLKANPGFSDKYSRASVRKDYWDLWRGQASKTIAKLDSDIAALKQQAIDGGC